MIRSLSWARYHRVLGANHWFLVFSWKYGVVLLLFPFYGLSTVLLSSPIAQSRGGIATQGGIVSMLSTNLMVFYSVFSICPVLWMNARARMRSKSSNHSQPTPSSWVALHLSSCLIVGTRLIIIFFLVHEILGALFALFLDRLLLPCCSGRYGLHYAHSHTSCICF